MTIWRIKRGWGAVFSLYYIKLSTFDVNELRKIRALYHHLDCCIVNSGFAFCLSCIRPVVCSQKYSDSFKIFFFYWIEQRFFIRIVLGVCEQQTDNRKGQLLLLCLCVRSLARKHVGRGVRRYPVCSLHRNVVTPDCLRNGEQSRLQPGQK